MPKPILTGMEIERRVGYARNGHPANLMNLNFTSLINQEQLEENSNFSLQIYTDGSKIDGKVGAALSCWEDETETKTIKLKLSSHSTVYQAEILAISRATEIIVKDTRQSYALYSDSRSALETIIDSSSQHTLAVEARENLRKAFEQNKNVSLFWIKAHAGITGNERADQLAKSAALKLKRAPDYDKCPISFARKLVRSESIDEWNRRYETGDTAKTTKVFFPEAKEAHKIIGKINFDNITAQILTGHGGFSEYLTRFKCKENSSCTCDPEVEETVIHILTECPVFGRQRYDTEQKLRNVIENKTISQIMKIPEDRNTFLKYSKEIVTIVLSRNK